MHLTSAHELALVNLVDVACESIVGIIKHSLNQVCIPLASFTFFASGREVGHGGSRIGWPGPVGGKTKERGNGEEDQRQMSGPLSKWKEIMDKLIAVGVHCNGKSEKSSERRNKQHE